MTSLRLSLINKWSHVKMIAIIDYGIGNVGSITNMLKKVKAESYLASTIADVQRAEKIILPGVGHFSSGMESLINSGLIETIEDKVLNERVPTLGICLGMQLMADYSEEGQVKGLGWVPGKVKNFSSRPNIGNNRVPHMGWNFTKEQKQSPLLNEFIEKSKFYFVHSYFYECENPDDVLLKTDYGGDFTSAFQKENIMGVQFHPEKSHKYGMKLLGNFAEMNL
mgnify:FL=1